MYFSLSTEKCFVLQWFSPVICEHICVHLLLVTFILLLHSSWPHWVWDSAYDMIKTPVKKTTWVYLVQQLPSPPSWQYGCLTKHRENPGSFLLHWSRRCFKRCQEVSRSFFIPRSISADITIRWIFLGARSPWVVWSMDPRSQGCHLGSWVWGHSYLICLV